MKSKVGNKQTTGNLAYATATRLTVGDIVFRTADKTSLKLRPTDDITPLESVRIATLLTFMTNTGFGGYTYDWQAYIDLHKLQRHFEVVL